MAHANLLKGEGGGGVPSLSVADPGRLYFCCCFFFFFLGGGKRQEGSTLSWQAKNSLKLHFLQAKSQLWQAFFWGGGGGGGDLLKPPNPLFV